MRGGTFTKTTLSNVAAFRNRIIDAVAITLEMLERTWEKLEYQMDAARTTNGAHVAVV